MRIKKMRVKNGILINVKKSDIKNGTFTIPNSVTSIGDWAFYSCTSLQSITIPDSVTSIGEGAFYCCESLQNITIPDGVTSIGNCAFYYCESLQNITIPDSVTSIGDSAFCNCTSLKSEERIYKAFKPNLSCQNYQYELGKWSDEIEDINICNKGYHFCTNLFDIFNYYSGRYGKDFVICECEIGNKILTHNEDSKCCTNKIKPIKKLAWSEVLNILNGGDGK